MYISIKSFRASQLFKLMEYLKLGLNETIRTLHKKGSRSIPGTLWGGGF